MATPSLTRNIRAGHLEIVGPDGRIEAETCTCFHCGRVWIVRGNEQPTDFGGWCRTCMRMICTPCSGQGCRPFEKRLDEYEAAQRWGRQLEAVL